MSDAPERIYLDGDVEAGDGMFPRCFENAKYVSDPPVEYIRSDLASAKLATCEKYRDTYAECDRIGTQAVRDLEAKLAECEARLEKAVEALKFYAEADNYEDQHKPESCGCCYYLHDAEIKEDEGAKARTTLAELKGIN